MRIAISEIDNSIRNVLKDADVLSVDSVYEKIDGSDDLKLVIFINKLLTDNISILYTKLLFVCNSGKEHLTDGSFSYLYDINCVYRKNKMSDISDFESKLKDIIDKKKFGEDILILSKFVENPAYLINNWFRNNKVKDISVSSVNYDPKVSVMPCDSLFFSFDVKVNESDDINLTLKKNGVNDFDYSFKIYDKNFTVKKDNLSTLVETIGDAIKNNL